MANIPNITLNNGKLMPQVGFGLWKVPNESASDIVYNAIKTGYRLFDGAFDYGNEKECGQGVARAIKDGLVTREELFIVSKLWNTFHEADKVEPIARQQLEWWGLEYFDLYHIHFPVALAYVDPAVSYPSGWNFTDGTVKTVAAPLHTTWAALESLVDLGLVRSIGVSNYQGSLLLDTLRYARIRPAVLQIEHHPYLAQPAILDLAKTEGIAVTGYSSLGPQSFLELGMAKNAEPLFANEVVVAAAKRAGKTPAQVLLRWATQRGIAVIPKSNTQSRVEENLDIVDWDLTEEELAAVSGLDRGLRFNNPLDYLGTLHIFA